MDLGLALLISFAARTAVLTLLLWLMVKLQKLDFFFFGLLGSGALAAALDMIPLVGHYFAVPVLYLCIWKVTRSSLVPDAIFTVAVAYALMFAVQVLLLTAWLPPIHPLPPEENPFAVRPARVAEPVAVFTAPPPAANLPPPAAPKKSADDWLNEITFKGVTQNGSKSALLVNAGTNLYQIEMTAATSVQTSTGTCQMRLVNVSETWATLNINGEETYLRLR